MSEELRFGRFEIRPTERLLLAGSEPVALGARAFDLLLALIDHRDRVVSKNELLDLVWPGVVVEEANVQVQVSNLRKLVDPRAVATIPGRGYRFVMPLHDAAGTTTEPRAVAQAPARARRRSNLPEWTEPLIGRDADVLAVSALVAEQRLVTVLGAGGIGKTRLAHAVAHSQVDRHADGVWWIDLAALSAAGQIAQAVAAAVQLQLGDGDGDATMLLARALEQRAALLLVLDNCEHLAGAVAGLARAILATAPGVRLLATSQELLQVAGEQVYRLDTLAVPPAGTPLAAAREHSALQLFERRARAADQRFAIGADSVGPAINLCRHLDGVPLAIEMAAARLPALGIEGVSRLVAAGVLRNLQRGAPGRQQTLRAMLDWSHALLDAQEQQVLRRLSVFAGSFEADLARCIVGDDADDEWAVFDTLSTLVDKSLLQVVREHPPRYRLLETMRLDATERLQQAGETAELHSRHGQALAALADAAVEALSVSSDAAWLGDYAGYYDDWRLAFDRACERRDAEVAGSTGRALAHIDRLRGDSATDRARMEAAYALLPLAGPRAQAMLWQLVSWPFFLQLPHVSRREAAQKEAAAWQVLGDRARQCHALWMLAREQAHAREWAAADATAAEARALEDPAWPPRQRLWPNRMAAHIQTVRGDLFGYRERGELALALAQQAGAAHSVVWARLDLADDALLAGDIVDAIDFFEAALADARALNWPNVVGYCRNRLFGAWLVAGDLTQARATAVETLPLLPLMSDCGWSAGFMNHVALLAAREGHPAWAAKLLGFAEATYAARRNRPMANERGLVAAAAAAIDASLGAAEHARLRAQGATCSAGDADALARQFLSAPTERPLP